MVLTKTDEAARHLSARCGKPGLFSDRTLRRWRRYGSGPRYVRVGGRVFYDLSELDRFVDELRTSDPRHIPAVRKPESRRRPGALPEDRSNSQGVETSLDEVVGDGEISSPQQTSRPALRQR